MSNWKTKFDDVMIIGGGGHYVASLASLHYPPCYTSPVFGVITSTLTYIWSQADPVMDVRLDLPISRGRGGRHNH